MQKFDVVIVGAGPAGGQCARQLAQSGKKILLLDKSPNLMINNYSSGGAPLSIMQKYNLPDKIISSYWRKLTLKTSNDSQDWSEKNPVGVILDFMKLRQFLIEETMENQGDVRLGCAYENHTQCRNETLVYIRNLNQHTHETILTKVLVEATGSERNVLIKRNYDQIHNLTVTGIEYEIQVNDSQYQKYSETLSFFLGQRWMPQGYAWIFPIHSNRIKVGVIRYFTHEKFVPHVPSIRFYLNEFIAQNLGTSTPQLLDKHGKTLCYTYRQRDLHFSENIIGIGDAISTLNPLAAEGIRHAMESGNIASEHILEFLNNRKTFEKYPKKMQGYYGMKWTLSERLMKKIYRESNDRNLDLILKTFKRFSFTDLLDLAFKYKFQQAIKFYGTYNCLRILNIFKCINFF